MQLSTSILTVVDPSFSLGYTSALLYKLIVGFDLGPGYENALNRRYLFSLLCQLMWAAVLAFASNTIVDKTACVNRASN